jgi:DNA-binding transcriptional LysR family regulator
MKVDLLITNRVVDLVAEGIDLAIRAGDLEDSSMIAKKFVSSHMKLWASPNYLEKRGTPSHPKDLAHHELVRFTAFSEDKIELTNGKEKFQITPTGRVSADDLEIIKVFSILGEGIGLFPTFLCEEETHSGKLTPVLPEWYWGSGHFSIVYPSHKFVSPKIHSFLTIATEIGKMCQAKGATLHYDSTQKPL